MSMWKRLFEAAPPGSRENFFTTQRKLVYGFFAFGPGTIVGAYLYSVKRKMEREDERLKLAAIHEEERTNEEHEAKDVALHHLIDDMRQRLQALEEEAKARRMEQLQQQQSKQKQSAPPPQQEQQKQPAVAKDKPLNKSQSTTSAGSSPSTPSSHQEQQRENQSASAEGLHTKALEFVQQQAQWLQDRMGFSSSSPSTTSSSSSSSPFDMTTSSGIRDRVDQLDRERIQEDVRQHQRRA